VGPRTAAFRRFDVTGAMPPYACCSDVPFENLVRFLTCFENAKKGDAKNRQLVEFRTKNVVRPSKDVYAIYRLLLPGVRMCMCMRRRGWLQPVLCTALRVRTLRVSRQQGAGFMRARPRRHRTTALRGRCGDSCAFPPPHPPMPPPPRLPRRATAACTY
jgi:hypothetical protein